MRKLDFNPEITQKAAQCGIFYWEIAQKLGIGDATFSRWMRKPLSSVVKKQIFEAIEELVNEKRVKVCG